MKNRSTFRCFTACLVLALHGRAAHSADWPTFMHDPARSGVTSAELSWPLASQWVYRAPVEPRPAWPPPQPGWTELPKVDFDDAFHAVADGERVYFGSSVDHQVHALDAATGAVRWKFFTSGPVRLAPTLAQGKVYFGSDDGKVYCLRREDGSLAWSFDAALDARRVLGNGKVISPWPVRTGVIVDGDRAYCGFGVFPFHRTGMLALRAGTGELLWKTDAVNTAGGFSPQGYLLAAGSEVIAPSGRAPAVCFDRESGKLLYNVPALGGKGESGGVYGVIDGGVLYVGTQDTLHGVNVATGTQANKWLTTAKLVATADSYFLLKGPPPPAYGRKAVGGKDNAITCLDRPAYQQLVRKDAEGLKKTTRWRYARPDLASLIVAGKQVIAGGRNEVVVLDAATGKELWVGAVEGDAVGLAVAHGRLLVSTTRGTVHCFARGTPGALPSRPAPTVDWPAEPTATVLDAAAQGILRQAGVRQGYAVVTGHAAAPLACALARHSELDVTCIEADRQQLALSRGRVAAAGLYGTRVSVEWGAPDALPYPEYAANLVVHVAGPGETGVAAKEVLRVLKPCGGVFLTGSLAAAGKPEVPEATLAVWRGAGLSPQEAQLSSGQRWTRLTRGALPGSGWWTHQYADSGGSGSSGDQRIKGQLEVLWFGEPGADEFPDRHQRGAAPLLLDGRVYCEGWNFQERTHTVFCFDAYNGVRYWKRELEGSVRLGIPAVTGNLACDRDSVFVAAGSRCYRLDARTGDTRALYETPADRDGSRRDWAYLAVADGVLVGSVGLPPRPRFSDRVFAIDLASGRQRWVHQGREILDATLALHDGRLCFADHRRSQRAVLADQPAPPAPAGEHGEAGRELPFKAGPCPRTVVALDLATGKPVWEKEVDLADCGRWENGVWGTMQALCKDGVLLFAGAYTIYNGGKADADHPHRAVALSIRDGATLWSAVLGNKSRPVMMRGAVLAEPFFFDPKTGTKQLKDPLPNGKALPLTMGPRTGGCGSLSASECMVFGRGGYTVWRNVAGGPSGTFVGMRPGCAINIIPAGGVVVQVEASSGCACYQAVQCTVVFRPKAAD
ncbi:MAG: PQQ-binding-like beta-propeller repeat protein [Planctomycetia bacterium]|nr:PQQ-binding-like beta-propeller repeat protein [Planctomycetia bacterium]